jgi:1-phosphatidylinositol-3-phosphate 5-kinase
MFEEMSSSYFEYLKESFARQCPTTIAKTLGIFKIKIRMESKARSESFYLLVMENLLIGVDEGCVRYDLKGSRRNRYITKKSDQPNQVTLDFNFLQDMKSRPIPLQYSMKRILNLAIHNDSLYLSKQSIIDYSMFVIINHQKKTVRLGIIDYIQ